MKHLIPDPDDIAPRLLAWFGRSRRDLPWRRTRDPYRIWLAEVMLQQTQVTRVADYYRRFLKAFPSVEAAACASLGEVLRLWEGLGYYSRARSFHAACKVVAERYGGRVPNSYSHFRDLPGVGDYTAGAVLSIAYGQPLPAIDANARRVLCRVFLEHGDTARSRRRIRSFGEAALPKDRPGDYNQALMELGSLVCRPMRPACDQCCLDDICRARQSGRQGSFPRRRRATTRTGHAVLGIVRRRGRVLIAQRPEDGVWGGLWEFPSFALEDGSSHTTALEQGLLDAFGLACVVEEYLGALSYGVMNRRIRVHVYACAVVRGRTRARDHVRAQWVRSSQLRAFALPAPHRRIADGYLPRAGASGPP